jgi:colanic acid/amylovoran/stewartan biosynthesis glycosyltransferase WcaL/AmsK/CpsK
VHLEGRQDQEGVRRFLNLAHLFVAPFVRAESGDQDGIPTALLEAMATGLPAVGTDAGSIDEVIDHGVEGWLVPQRSPLHLADAIEALLKDPDRRKTMGLAARARVERQFDVEVCEKVLHERVLRLLERR